MKFIPLLFSTLMVQALPRKTQTRRIIKPQPTLNDKKNDTWNYSFKKHSGINVPSSDFNDPFVGIIEECPYGKSGDVLWVRECFRAIEQEGGGYRYEYKATETIDLTRDWKPSIHMPKEACRHFLQIKNIRAERLQDITEADAIAEGVATKEFGTLDFKVKYLYECYTNMEFGFCETARSSYFTLWNLINGKDAAKQNPWVWVIEFEQIAKPKGFC